MRIRIGLSLVLAGVVATALYTFVSIQRSAAAALFLENRRCCQLSFMRNLQVMLDEIRGLRSTPPKSVRTSGCSRKCSPT